MNTQNTDWNTIDKTELTYDVVKLIYDNTEKFLIEQRVIFEYYANKSQYMLSFCFIIISGVITFLFTHSSIDNWVLILSAVIIGGISLSAFTWLRVLKTTRIPSTYNKPDEYFQDNLYTQSSIEFLLSSIELMNNKINDNNIVCDKNIKLLKDGYFYIIFTLILVIILLFIFAFFN